MLDHVLTDKELEMVLEVLKTESQRLMIDARRTDVQATRKEIRERLRAVDRNVDRLEEFKAKDYTA